MEVNVLLYCCELVFWMGRRKPDGGESVSLGFFFNVKQKVNFDETLELTFNEFFYSLFIFNVAKLKLQLILVHYNQLIIINVRQVHS